MEAVEPWRNSLPANIQILFRTDQLRNFQDRLGKAWCGGAKRGASLGGTTTLCGVSRTGVQKVVNSDVNVELMPWFAVDFELCRT